jgi:hypothetical protein
VKESEEPGYVGRGAKDLSTSKRAFSLCRRGYTSRTLSIVSKASTLEPGHHVDSIRFFFSRIVFNESGVKRRVCAGLDEATSKHGWKIVENSRELVDLTPLLNMFFPKGFLHPTPDRGSSLASFIMSTLVPWYTYCLSTSNQGSTRFPILSIACCPKCCATPCYSL